VPCTLRTAIPTYNIIYFNAVGIYIYLRSVATSAV
jgi:hypothetical protein